MKKIILIASCLLFISSVVLSVYCGISSKKANSEAFQMFSQVELLTQSESDLYPCSSGGPGSRSCSASVSGAGFGSACDVECDPGFYACCNAMENKCQCRPNGV